MPGEWVRGLLGKYLNGINGVYYNVEDCSGRECTIVIDIDRSYVTWIRHDEAPQLGPKRPFVDYTHYLEVRFADDAVIHLAYKFGEAILYVNSMMVGTGRMVKKVECGPDEVEEWDVPEVQFALGSIIIEDRRIRIRLVAIRNEDEKEC